MEGVFSYVIWKVVFNILKIVLKLWLDEKLQRLFLAMQER